MSEGVVRVHRKLLHSCKHVSWCTVGVTCGNLLLWPPIFRDNLYSRTTWSRPNCYFTMCFFTSIKRPKTTWSCPNCDFTMCFYSETTSIQRPLGHVPIVTFNVCFYLYSELPLMSPEMWPPLYSGHFEKSQSMLYSTNSPLKWGHPSNQDTLTGPKGGQIRGTSLYSETTSIQRPLFGPTVVT